MMHPLNGGTEETKSGMSLLNLYLVSVESGI